MSTRLVRASFAALLFAGCGGAIKSNVGDAGDDTGTDVHVDTGTDVPDDTGTDVEEDAGVDVPVDTPADGTPPECDHDLGTWTPGETFAGLGWSGGYWVETGSINPTFWPPPISEVVIEAFPEFGGAGAPGTYTISAWEAGDTCLLCIWVYVECSSWFTGCSHYYMADRATLVIDSIDRRVGGTVSGTLSNVHFIEVNADGTAVIEGGMTYCLDLWEFSDTYESMGG